VLAVIPGAARVVNVLLDQRKAASVGVLAELTELGLRILAAIDGGYPGVDDGASPSS
jgi:hypothetical protein